MAKRSLSVAHRQKISEALKRYNKRPDNHLQAFHKSGDSHPGWKNGSSPKYYRNLGFSIHGNLCELCGGEAILIHHKDENRQNNDPMNLQPLCRSCHQKTHLGKCRLEWVCPACGNTIFLQPHQVKRRKFCTVACKQKHRGEGGKYV